MIIDIGHVALRVDDVDASVAVATEVLGMTEVERVDGTAYLSHRSPYPSLGPLCPHHVLELIPGDGLRVDHIGLLARAGSEAQLVERAVAAGGSVVGEAGEPGVERATRVASPAGHVFELYSRMESVRRGYEPKGVPPSRLGHATLRTADPEGLMSFFVDAFGFDVTDRIVSAEGTQLAFGRCHFDHHTLAVFAGPDEGLHHIAFEVGSMVEIGALADCLARRGESFVWGPVRHGAGDNIAVYLAGPGGLCIEVYTGMQRIVGDGWDPRRWSLEDPVGLNEWAPPAGFEAILDFHAPLAVPARTPA